MFKIPLYRTQLHINLAAFNIIKPQKDKDLEVSKRKTSFSSQLTSAGKGLQGEQICDPSLPAYICMLFISRQSS